MFRRLLVFGATGDTGLNFVRLACQAGHNVTCFLRNPSKLTYKHDNLKLLKGDIDNREAITNVMKDQDAIVSCLGVHQSSPWNRTKLYTTSMDTIIAGMKSTGLKRVVSITSWHTQLQRDKSNPIWIDYFAKPLFFSGFIYDMGQMEINLSKTEGIDYTIVRPPGLSNGVSKNATVYAVDKYQVDDCDIFIPRVDVAEFMVQTLQTDQFNRHCVSIGSSSKKKKPSDKN